MTQTRKWSGMTVVAVVLIVAMGWLLLITPARGVTADVLAQKQATDSTNADTRIMIEKLKKQAEEVEIYRAKLQKLEKRIPQSAELPKIIRSLQKTTDGVGIDWTKFDPEPPKTMAMPALDGAPVDPTAVPGESTEGLYLVLISMEAQGSYVQMEKLLRKIEDMQRAFLVTSVSFASTPKRDPKKPDEPILELKLSGQVYTRTGKIVADTPAPAKPTATPSTPRSGGVSDTSKLG